MNLSYIVVLSLSISCLFSNYTGVDNKNKSFSFQKKDRGVLKGSDALLLLTEWPEFRSPDFNKLGSILKNKIIFDGRNQFDKDFLKKIGFEYHQIGVRQI